MKKKGFTLIEVLIVIIIIGILAAIALPQYVSTLEKARSAEALGALGSMRSAMDRYWYEQISQNGYVTLTSLDSLDVEIDQTKWTYTFSDRTPVGSVNLADKEYVFIATRVGKADYWIQINQAGTMSKSTTLGGTGVAL
jgi:prepilin-type N-terminal cleavage/methylation domain-containing protein